LTACSIFALAFGVSSRGLVAEPDVEGRESPLPDDVVVDCPGVDVAGPVAVPAPVVLVPVAPVVGVLVWGVVVLGTVVDWVGATAPAELVIVWMLVTVLVELPASETSAAAITPSERAMTIAITAIGFFQFGDAARRVRAAAPQRTHHSCSGCSGAPQSGHASPGAGVGDAGGDGAAVPGGGGAATLMSPVRVAG
jgi:hypothetical protein